MMNLDTCQKVCSLLGCFLLLLPTGLQWYWGNMETYIISFFHSKSSEVTGNESWWITSVFLLTRVVTIIGTGVLLRHYCAYWIAFIGILLFNAGMCTSYFAVYHSIAMLTFTFGGICGVGTGVLFSAAMDMAISWEDNDSGLIIALVQSSYTFGAILVIQALTLYINPHNKVPGDKNEHYAFFEQVDIINGVPFLFLVLGFSFMVIQLTGILLVRRQPPLSFKRGRLKDSNEMNDEQREVTIPMENNHDSNSGLTVDNQEASSVRKMLHSKTFYVLWISHLLGNFAYLVLTNVYKAFGQTKIKDDHFFSMLGTAIVIVSVVMKIIYGFISDKLGSKIGLMGVFVFMAISSAFMYLAPLVDKWFYFIDVIMLAIPSGTVLTSHSIALVQFFGSREVAMKTGLMSSAAMLLLFTAPPLMRFIIDIAGWLGIFFTAAFVSLSSLVLIVFGL